MALTQPQMLRNRVASLERHHPNTPAVLDARRELAAAKAETYVERLISQAPPLTNEQRERIASLLAPQAVIQGAA